MATLRNSYHAQTTINASELFIAIVTTQWHREIVSEMELSAVSTLVKAGVVTSAIASYVVPGAYELPLLVARLCRMKKYHAVIAFGCIIRGETPHFDFVAAPVAHALQTIQVETEVPTIFGVLTTNTEQQALDRVNGVHGNKGHDCAIAAIEMATLMNILST